MEIKRTVKGKDIRLTKELERCNQYLLTLKRECEDGYQRLSQISGFTLHLSHLLSELERFLEWMTQEDIRKLLVEFSEFSQYQ